MAKDNAGVLVVARKMQLYPGKPLLLGLRSRHLRAPHTWCCWGGRMEPGESPAQAAAREFREESGFRGPLTLVPGSEWAHRVGLPGLFRLYTFHNHLGTVAEQFDPPGVPNYEVEQARWMSLEEVEALPWSSVLHAPEGGLHFGLQAYLARQEVRLLLHHLCEQARATAAGGAR
jgi:8-oxo-dGTP pyrophosphatase MutT (NUDIX family)